jgi:hypothetical protein
MATRTNGKNLSLTINAVEINAEGTSVVLDNEDADDTDVTFADLDDGDPKQWFFSLAALADYGVGSVWTMLWEEAGNDVAFVFKPYGNAVATAAQPHFTGSAKILSKPPIGGAAGETFNFEARLDVDGVPVRVIA